MVELTFVSVSKGQPSTRSKELQLSAVRSHNAKLAHARKKALKPTRVVESHQISILTNGQWQTESPNRENDFWGERRSVDLCYQSFFGTPRSVKICMSVRSALSVLM